MAAFGSDTYVQVWNQAYNTTWNSDGGYSTSTSWVSSYVRADIATGTNLVPIQLDPKEVKRRRLFALTQEAIQEARETLRATNDDPAGLLPRRPRREASKRLHDRPRFRRRICAGSSRYRVMWS